MANRQEPERPAKDTQPSQKQLDELEREIGDAEAKAEEALPHKPDRSFAEDGPEEGREP